MPPSRKKTGPATKGAQSTLSFGARTKVTKPTTSNAKNAKSTDGLAKALKRSEADTAPETADLGHVYAEAAIAKQAEAELKKPRTDEEIRAEKVTDAQIKKYWRACEAERKAPRVHQEGLSTEEKILRLFDMSSQYGPAIGIARMKRWVRANKLGLNPPIEVLAVLLKEAHKGNMAIERAHVDELMSNKFVVGEA